MTKSTFRIPQFWLGLIPASLVLIGCAGLAPPQSRAAKIMISSEPTGAIAYADGAELGVTPLKIQPSDNFRSGFVGSSYRYFGKLTLRKPGCEPWSTEVDDHVLSHDVRVKLKCDPGLLPASEATLNPTANPQSAAGSASRLNDKTAERLKRIESLRKGGLISDEEYRKARARIIEQL